MTISTDRIYQLALLVIFVLAIILIINYLIHKPIIIERENMDARQMIGPQYQDWIIPPEFYYKNNYYYANKLSQNPNSQPTFYLKDDQFFNKKNFNQNLLDPLNFDNDQQCGTKLDWNVPLSPGADGGYTDLMWNYNSPKMALEGNCLNCNHYKPFNLVNKEPSGIPSNLTSYYEGTMEKGFLKDQKILDDSFLPKNLATGNTYMSGSMINKYVSSEINDETPFMNYESKCSI